MKKILIAGVLAFCTFHSFGQIRIPGTVGGGYAHGINIGGTSTIIGTSPTTTPGNVIIGNGTGNLNTAGGNTFIGQDAANSNTTGYANTFLGRWTGSANSTGYGNTFLGQFSGNANTTAAHNVFVGQGAGSATTTGGDNVFIGQSSAPDNTTGNHNTFIGKISGDNNITGTSNTALGFNTNFSSGNLTNATAIGANAQAGASNTMILGGTGSNAVRVGIGTPTPAAHIHTVNPGSESIIFSTTSNFSNSYVNMKAGINNSYNFANGSSLSGTYLPFITANTAPAVPNANLAGLITDGTPLVLGVDGGDKNGSIHFVNWLINGSGFISRAECMRVNKSNGFVGVHTRSANTASGSGEPQTLFHVNLTNPFNSNLDPLTQGIRFEGLPAGQQRHNQTVVVDPLTGDLAMSPGGIVGNAWELAGNTISAGDFIGTLNNLDFEIRTNNTQKALFTTDGNFDLGSAGSNAIVNSSTTSAAIGQNNILDHVTSSIETGRGNTIRNSQFSAAFGDGNTIDVNSNTSQATGKNNSITDADQSMAMGENNSISNSESVFAGGLDNDIFNTSTYVMAYGDDNNIEGSYASGIIGEENDMMNGHGCFIGGGHNNSQGEYNFIGGSHIDVNGQNNYIGGRHNTAVGNFNFLWGTYLTGNLASSTAVPANYTDINPYLMVIGERINSNLSRSLSIGFNGNRTSVTTERGMAVQLDPTSGNTYQPTVNFEVDAAIAPSPGPMSIGVPQSNIRFHNLPLDPQRRMLPAVLYDPNTGELFQSQNLYMRPGKDDSGVELDSLLKENEALKERVAQLESEVATIPQLHSQVALYDEKFAQLERSIEQICESGCAGLKSFSNDELYQSVPNPGDNKVMINYHLSRNYAQANITLYSMDGHELNTYRLTPNKGDGVVNISLGELQSGTYLYRLVVDGKPIDVKKLQKL